MKLTRVAAMRLHNQGMLTAPFENAGDVVSWLVAAQSQDFYGAMWSLGVRMRSAIEGDIQAAFQRGAILRTHVLRPTWHFVTPQDIRWLLALTAPRVHRVNGTMYRRLELDEATLVHGMRAIETGLVDGAALTREELGEVLQRAGIDVQERLRLTYLVMYAELEGLICSGPRRGKQFTYMLLDERAPEALRLDRQDALVELTRRYFVSRGPATAHDFAKWSGLTLGDAREGLEAVGGELEGETLDGQEYWFSGKTPFPEKPGPRAHLLSVYDEYFIGYKDRAAIADDATYERLVGMGNALTYIIVLDGLIAGTWRRTLGKEAVTIELNPFKPLDQAEQRAVSEAAERYGEFLGLAVKLEH